jgi:hypothetical protein
MGEVNRHVAGEATANIVGSYGHGVSPCASIPW